MKYQIKKIGMLAIIVFSVFYFSVSAVFAVSDTFPASTDPPTVADFLPSPNNTYYCSPSGNNTTGDGSIGSPWVDFIGATSGGAGSAVTAGDLLYLRGGTYPYYPYVNFSRSQNSLQRNGTGANPIVVTNYPGEIAQWNDQNTWSVTIRGDYIKFIGTKVGSSYGIIITGGMTFHEGNYAQISGVDFVKGTSNGGDLNPAMLADPLNGTNQTGVIISHNRFRDSEWAIAEHRMRCIGAFTTRGLVIEYNIFKDNKELRNDAGCILFKDTTTNATVRYNKFINCVSGSSLQSQGSAINGLTFYENLFYDVDECFVITNRLGNSGAISIYNNVALAITTSFYVYFNYDNQNWSVHGDFYNNVIDGTAFARDWPSTSADEKNIPDLFDYNLWYSSGDRNTPSGWSLPSGYYSHSVTSNNAITYNSNNQTCTVEDDYPGRNKGRNGDCIGGFKFGSGGDDDNPPGDVSNFTAQAGDNQVVLNWVNPTDSDFKGTLIRYSTGNDPYPATKNDGAFLCDREANPGSSDSFTATGLDNGTKYNFSAFTYDEAGNYSETAHVSATPTSEPPQAPANPSGVEVVK